MRTGWIIYLVSFVLESNSRFFRAQLSLCHKENYFVNNPADCIPPVRLEELAQVISLDDFFEKVILPVFLILPVIGYPVYNR